MGSLRCSVVIDRALQRRHSGLRMGITFDRNGRCGQPVVWYREGPEPEMWEAMALDQSGNWISVDLDQDGTADGRIPNPA